MLKGLRTAIYHVGDLDRAKGWYGEVLGKEPYFDEPFYVGFDVGGFELGLQPDEGGAPRSSTGVVAYWGVDDAEAALARLLELGATGRSKRPGRGGGYPARLRSRPVRQRLRHHREPALLARGRVGVTPNYPAPFCYASRVPDDAFREPVGDRCESRQ